jgi:hypothetical protein
MTSSIFHPTECEFTKMLAKNGPTELKSSCANSSVPKISLCLHVQGAYELSCGVLKILFLLYILNGISVVASAMQSISDARQLPNKYAYRRFFCMLRNTRSKLMRIIYHLRL